jgi:hypothetical protein
VSPKIAAVYKVSNSLSFRSLLARAFRNPSIAERYTKFEQGGGFRFQVSPYLKAEKLTLSAELGSKISFGSKFKIDAALYYNRYKDLISYKQVSLPGEDLVFEVVNLAKSLMQGFEISFEYDPFKNLKLLAVTITSTHAISPMDESMMCCLTNPNTRPTSTPSILSKFYTSPCLVIRAVKSMKYLFSPERTGRLFFIEYKTLSSNHPLLIGLFSGRQYDRCTI